MQKLKSKPEAKPELELELRRIIYAEGPKLWPWPYPLAMQGEIQSLEQWEKVKQGHIAYWRNRFGLDDAIPCQMRPARLHAKAKLGKDYLLFRLIGQAPCKTYCEMPIVKLTELIEKHSFNAVWVRPTIVKLYGSPQPMHDWVQYADWLKLLHYRHKYESRSNKFCNKARAGLLSESDIEALTRQLAVQKPAKYERKLIDSRIASYRLGLSPFASLDEFTSALLYELGWPEQKYEQY